MEATENFSVCSVISVFSLWIFLPGRLILVEVRIDRPLVSALRAAEIDQSMLRRGGRQCVHDIVRSAVWALHSEVARPPCGDLSSDREFELLS